MIEQWGVQTYSKSVTGAGISDGSAITFNVSFKNIPSIVLTSNEQHQFNMSAISRSVNGFTPRYRNINSGNTATTTGCSWTVKGY